MRYLFALAIILYGLLVVSKASAHEMVPTYPKLKQSYMDGLYTTTMTMFNKRPEVEYYEIGVFTKDWEPIPFVSTYRVFPVPYLSTVTVELFIRDVDQNNITYICSKSKLRKSYETHSAVSSRICSKVKRRGE